MDQSSHLALIYRDETKHLLRLPRMRGPGTLEITLTLLRRLGEVRDVLLN